MSSVHKDAKAFFTEAYRVGFVPSEAAGAAAAEFESSFFDRETQAHPGSTRRALDIGCGRGSHAVMLAERGWQVTGVDYVPDAITAARQRPGAESVDFVVGDASELAACAQGPFDFFLDGGCYHGLSPEDGWGEGVQALAAPDATLLMVAFDPWPGSKAPPNVPSGTTLDEVLDRLPGWQLTDDDLMPDAFRPVPQPAHFYRLQRTTA